MFEISKNSIKVVITWSQLARMKIQPVQPRQILPYDYMWKLNFVLARRDSFPPGIWLDLHDFLWIFLCKHVILQNWRFIDFHWFNFFYLSCLVFSCLIFFRKIRSSRSQMFFKIGVIKNFSHRLASYESKKNAIEISSIYWNVLLWTFFN